jgi:hypothetical protein
MRDGIRRIGAVLLAVVGVALAGAARAQEPVGEPVKWDQARVTQYAVELDQKVDLAVDALRKSPMKDQPAQRTVWYELKEDLRLIKNSTEHLKTELQKGAGMDETKSTFARIGSLRNDAAEVGRRFMIEAPVMDALFSAGATHNLMMPYYYGKR